jgi:hypothetical protein
LPLCFSLNAHSWFLSCRVCSKQSRERKVVIKDLEEKKQLYVSQAKNRLGDLETRVIASGIPKEWAGKSR